MRSNAIHRMRVGLSVILWMAAGTGLVCTAGDLQAPSAKEPGPMRIQKSMTSMPSEDSAPSAATAGAAGSVRAPTGSVNGPAPAPGKESEGIGGPLAPGAEGAPAVSSGPGGSIRADARAEPTHVQYGDTVRYDVDVVWKGKYQVDEIVPPDDLGGFLLDSTGIPNTGGDSAGGGGEYRQTFTLRAIKGGTQQIPSFEVHYHLGAAGKTESLPSPAVDVTVASAEAGTAKGKLQPLAPPAAIPFNWTLRNIIIGGSILVLLLLGWLGWILFRRVEARREALRPPPPPRPAHIIAYEELEALGRTTYLRDGRFKLFFTELSEILRRYVQNRYRQPALDWTSYEIIEALSRYDDPSAEDRQHLSDLFDVCDLVKFAKWTPPEGRGERLLDEATRFVDVTREQRREEVA